MDYPCKKQQVDIIDIRCLTHETSFSQELQAALSSEHPSLPPRLLWDEKGLQHFEAITFAEDYYLTNCEIGLLRLHSNEIAEQIPENSVLLELGSGCLRKIKILLDALEALGKSVDYFALDLSYPELERTLTDIHPDEYVYVRCHGLLGTFEDGNKVLRSKELRQRPKCILSLGSTIGSASRHEAAKFLGSFLGGIKSASVHATAMFVVGVDGCKDGAVVWKAYNDPEGCNARFIINALQHANTVLGYEAFDPKDWDVHGEWNGAQGRHEQYLVPNRAVSVQGIPFLKGQRLSVISSHKYDTAEQSKLWDGAGLQLENCWNTEPHHYSLNVLSAAQDAAP